MTYISFCKISLNKLFIGALQMTHLLKSWGVSANFFYKEKIANILDFASYGISAATIQLCYSSVK